MNLRRDLQNPKQDFRAPISNLLEFYWVSAILKRELKDL